MIHVIASIEVKQGRVLDFIEIFKSNMPNVLQEKGCIQYVPCIDIPTKLPPQKMNSLGVTIIEKWESLEDLNAHISSPHMIAYKKKVADLVDSLSLKILTEA